MVFKKIKVLYDDQIFTLQKIGGISRYFNELYARNRKAKVALLHTENFYLEDKNKIKVNFRGKQRIFNFLNRNYSLLLLKLNNFDIFHPTYYNTYFLKSLKKPFVITVYDMIHEVYSGIYYSENMEITKIKMELCKKADGIIAISEQTKKDLIKYFNIEESKIKVIYLGSNLQKKQSKIELPNKYILFTGRRWGYKNFNLFLEALSKILVEDKELKLVCTGEKFTEEERAKIRKLGIEDKVVNILVKDEDIYTVYKRAECFVFPSLYEGFGIPILEAFEAETPLVLSNTSCFPEIAGDAGEYFNPKDKISIENAVRNVLNNFEKRKELIAKGKERLKLFDWNKTYRETIIFYNEIIEKNKAKR